MKNYFVIFLLIFIPIIGASQEFKQIGTITDQVEDFEVFKTTLLETHVGIYDYNDSLSLFTNLSHLEKAINTHPLTQIEQVALYSRFISTIKCAHTIVHHKKLTRWSLDAKYKLPFQLYFINGELRSGEIFKSNQINIETNDKIISINGELIKDLKDSLHLFISSDGKNITYKNQKLKHNFLYYYFLYAHKESDLSIKYIHEKDTITSSVPLIRSNHQKVKKNKKKESIQFSQDTSKNVAILTLPVPLLATKKYNKELTSIFEKLERQNTKNLILDLRNNPGGKKQNHFFSFFIDTNMVFNNSQYGPLHAATYKKHFIKKNKLQFIITKFSGKHLQSGTTSLEEVKSHKYSGQLYVLINGRTGSAASNLASLLKEWPQAIIVGEETGGGAKSMNTGGAILQLPNSKIRINMPTIKVTNNVKINKESDSVTPNFVVYESNDYEDTNDMQLNYIYELIFRKSE